MYNKPQHKWQEKPNVKVSKPLISLGIFHVKILKRTVGILLTEGVSSISYRLQKR
jgi:hypothetical protein